MAKAESSKAPAPGGYVDPMVAVAASQNTRPKSRAYRPPATTTENEADTMQVAQLVPSEQADLGALVNQPTAVQAGNTSIFALATARADAANAASGAASYAPVGRINPMVGSVFSARAPADTIAPPPASAPRPAPQPATHATGTSAKDGLW
jgi:hypothetical protein